MLSLLQKMQLAAFPPMQDHKPLRPEKVADSVARHIEGLILEGSLQPGEPLLPEREMAMRLNVSRPTLRDALKALEERGLLTSREGRGMRVARIGAGAITDPLIAMLAERQEVADDYLEFRDVVESSAAAMAAERANDLDLARIGECARRITEAHDAGDPADEAEADAALHLAIYEASHNLVLLLIMRALSSNLKTDVLQNRQRLFTIPDIRETLRDQHLAIAGTIMRRQPDAARAAAHEHLAYLRRTVQQIREDEGRIGLSQRRLNGGGLGARRD